MPQNISGINAANSVNTSFEPKTKETDEADKKPAGNSLEKTDENIYLDADFEDMSLEDVANVAQSLNDELLGLQMEVENIETILETNESIKQAFENQRENIKKQLKQLQEKLQKAKTAEEKNNLRKQLTTLKSNIEVLNSQISAILNTIQVYSASKTAATADLAQVNQSYRKAQLAQNTKENELNRSSNDANSAQISGASSPALNTGSMPPKGASSGKVSNNMLNSLQSFEGCRLNAYQDSGGVWTIGYGHTSGVQPGQTISKAQANEYLRQDIASFENEVSTLAQSKGVKLTQGQFDALVSFSYNCGGGNLRSSGIMDMLKKGNIDAAASKMKEYVHAGGEVLQGLVKRREIEASWLYA